MSDKPNSTAQPFAYELFQQAWPECPTLLLCDRQARKGIAVVAVNGECPVHGGDGCLFMYVQVSAARRKVADLES